jgi:ribosomal protein S18 acetylase RimI-like enzyme
MNIRPARPEDAREIAALVAAVWVVTYATEGVTPAIAEVLAKITPAKIAADLAHPGRRAWVATEGEGLLGFADLQPEQSTPCVGAIRQAEVLHLYVHERHARRGVGTRLLEACTEHAFAHGSEAVWLSVWERNDRAIRFYEALGWTRCGDTTFRLGDVDHANRIYALRRPPRSPAGHPRSGRGAAS